MEIPLRDLCDKKTLFDPFGRILIVEEKLNETNPGLKNPRKIEIDGEKIYCPLRSAGGYKMVGIFLLKEPNLVDLGDLSVDRPREPRQKTPIKTTFLKETPLKKTEKDFAA